MSSTATWGDNWTVASYLAHTDDFPRSLRQRADRGLAPALDVARAIEHDAAALLRFHPRSTRSDRVAGFLRVVHTKGHEPDCLACILLPVERGEVAEILADLLEVIAEQIAAQAGPPASSPYRLGTVARNFRDYRDAVARLSPRPTTALLSMLAPRLRVDRVEVERHARAWVLAQPRVRTRRSTFADRYRGEGSPGGLNVRELLTLTRATLGEAVETASRGEVYLSLQNHPDTV